MQLKRFKNTSIFLIILLTISCNPVFSDIIYLKNGEILQGEITYQDKDIIILNKGSETLRVQKSLIDLVSRENNNNIEKLQKNEPFTIQSELDFQFGPSLGIFRPIENYLFNYHTINYFPGLGVSVWVNSMGLRIEAEQYTDTFKGRTYDTYNNIVYIKEKLNLSFISISFLQRTEKDFFLMYGPGISLVIADMSINLDNYNMPGISDLFWGYYLILGLGMKHTSLAIKYYTVPTNDNWGAYTNLGGIVITFQYFF